MAKEKINFEDEQTRLKYRHTTSHIMAQAVKNLWPDVKLAIGPAIENGFYYDFDMDHKISDQDLLKIQKEMKKIIKANYPLERFELPREEAIKFMEDKGEDYKVELIKDLPEDEPEEDLDEEPEKKSVDVEEHADPGKACPPPAEAGRQDGRKRGRSSGGQYR